MVPEDEAQEGSRYKVHSHEMSHYTIPYKRFPPSSETSSFLHHQTSVARQSLSEYTPSHNT